jgi:[ribosomal protein S18]-alanine N-acetyltransferase
MIRNYLPDDYTKVMEVFRLNVPQFFASEEEADLRDYLKEHGESYYVIEVKGEIIGAGGHHYPLPGVGRLSWDFFRPEVQGKGWGRKLINHSLDEIRSKKHVKRLEVWTSQQSYQFYAKFGFNVHRVEKDFWAKGFDLYHMEMIADKIQRPTYF